MTFLCVLGFFYVEQAGKVDDDRLPKVTPSIVSCLTLSKKHDSGIALTSADACTRQERSQLPGSRVFAE